MCKHFVSENVNKFFECVLGVERAIDLCFDSVVITVGLLGRVTQSEFINSWIHDGLGGSAGRVADC